MFQVSSFLAPVWAHVQQQLQHCLHIWREALISSVYPMDSLVRCQCYWLSVYTQSFNHLDWKSSNCQCRL